MSFEWKQVQRRILATQCFLFSNKQQMSKKTTKTYQKRSIYEQRKEDEKVTKAGWLWHFNRHTKMQNYQDTKTQKWIK